MGESSDRVKPWEKLEKEDLNKFTEEMNKILDNPKYCESKGLDYSKIEIGNIHNLKLRVYEKMFSSEK